MATGTVPAPYPQRPSPAGHSPAVPRGVVSRTAIHSATTPCADASRDDIICALQPPRDHALPSHATRQHHPRQCPLQCCPLRHSSHCRPCEALTSATMSPALLPSTTSLLVRPSSTWPSVKWSSTGRPCPVRPCLVRPPLPPQTTTLLFERPSPVRAYPLRRHRLRVLPSCVPPPVCP